MKLHSHLVSSPQFLGATSSGSASAEDFVYVVNEDGTAAVCQWNRSEGMISWRPWETEGAFLAIYQAFGRTHAVVQRSLGGQVGNHREFFHEDAVMDCISAMSLRGGVVEGGEAYWGGISSYANHLTGETVPVYFEGWDMGDFLIDAAGRPVRNGEDLLFPVFDGYAQVGLARPVRVVPWSRRSARTQSGVREVKREVELYLSVRETSAFKVDGLSFGEYRVGEDMTAPPRLRTQQFRVVNKGAAAYKRHVISQDRPGKFCLTKLGYKVVI